jgi:hypothetical protein
MRLVTFLF